MSFTCRGGWGWEPMGGISETCERQTPQEPEAWWEGRRTWWCSLDGHSETCGPWQQGALRLKNSARPDFWKIFSRLQSNMESTSIRARGIQMRMLATLTSPWEAAMPNLPSPWPPLPSSMGRWCRVTTWPAWRRRRRSPRSGATLAARLSPQHSCKSSCREYQLIHLVGMKRWQ